MRRRPFVVAGVLGVAVALGACGGDDGTAGDPTTTTVDPTTTTVVDETTTTEAEPVDEEAAVLAAYTEAWAVYPSYLNGEAEEPLEAYFAGDRLANIPRFIVEYAEQGKRLEGQAVLSPGPVTLDGSSAAFTDCLLDQTTAVSVASGEVLGEPKELPQEVAVEMQKIDGTWKMASVVFSEEGSCTR